MAWTEEARRKALEARKKAAYQKRLQKAKAAFTQDRKSEQARFQHRSLATGKLTSAGDSSGTYIVGIGESRGGKTTERDIQKLKTLAATMKTTNYKSRGKGKTPEQARDLKGKYVSEGTARATKIISEMTANDPVQTRKNLVSVATSIMQKGGTKSLSGDVLSGKMKVSDVQTVNKILDAASSLPTKSLPKLKGKTSGPATAKRIKPKNITAADVAKVIASSTYKKPVPGHNPFLDIEEDDF